MEVYPNNHLLMASNPVIKVGLQHHNRLLHYQNGKLSCNSYRSLSHGQFRHPLGASTRICGVQLYYDWGWGVMPPPLELPLRRNKKCQACMKPGTSRGHYPLLHRHIATKHFHYNSTHNDDDRHSTTRLPSVGLTQAHPHYTYVRSHSGKG